MVDTCQMEDGSNFFDHFEINSEGNYVNVSGQYESENIYHNREPRFYGSMLYDGALWQPRLLNLVGRDPVGIYDRRTQITMENGEVTFQVFGIDTRQGPVENCNGSFTGYIMKKLLEVVKEGRLLKELEPVAAAVFANVSRHSLREEAADHLEVIDPNAGRARSNVQDLV